MNSYEKRIIVIMIDEGCTFAEALLIDFEANNVNTSSIFDLVDYLEAQVETLDQVEYIMDVFVGRKPDMILKALEKDESKKK